MLEQENVYERSMPTNIWCSTKLVIKVTFKKEEERRESESFLGGSQYLVVSHEETKVWRRAKELPTFHTSESIRQSICIGNIQHIPIPIVAVLARREFAIYWLVIHLYPCDTNPTHVARHQKLTMMKKDHDSYPKRRIAHFLFLFLSFIHYAFFFLSL